MKEHVYLEGIEATKNFEEGMKALFKVPKEKVVKAVKKQASRSSQTKKPKRADED